MEEPETEIRKKKIILKNRLRKTRKWKKNNGKYKKKIWKRRNRKWKNSDKSEIQNKKKRNMK